MNDPIPAFKLVLKSLRANINSKSTAPSIGPRNIPTILPITKPTRPPNIAPNIPQLLPPNFLAPKATTILSMNVESKESMNSIININGVIISKLPIQANMNTDRYTNQTPGSVKRVKRIPPILRSAKRMYMMVFNILESFQNLLKRYLLFSQKR